MRCVADSQASPCPPVLATFAVTTMMRTPDTYRESESRYSGLYAEYATWLYLTSDEKPEPHRDRPREGARVIPRLQIRQEVADEVRTMPSTGAHSAP